jgi:hypothetical protein
MAPEWIISLLLAVSAGIGAGYCLYYFGNTIKTAALPAHGDDFFHACRDFTG